MSNVNEIRIYNNKNTEDKVQGSDSGRAATNKNTISSNDNQDEKRCKKKIKIIVAISVGLIITLSAVLLIVFKPWKEDNNNNNNNGNGNNKDNTDDIDNQENHYAININDYKNELAFKTKVNDLRRISVKEKSYENMIINGIEIKTEYLRNTHHDIYIISEIDADEENRGVYNKIFTGSISMVSQCLSKENEECELKQLVDLLNNNKKNLGSLKEIDDLKDIPIPLCLFNITDTNIITSIKCPESLPESIKNELLSDLYYFRPMAKLSSTKTHEMDVTTDGNIKNIRKQSKGLCDMNSNSPSICNIDSNITKDSEGNLLSFDETSFIDITTDINNKISNNKTTHLIDETSQINYLNPDQFKSILNDLLLKLNPYMKYEEIDTINKVSKQSNSKVINDRFYSKRHLEENDDMIYEKYLMKEESLFYKEILGTIINLNLKIDSGINVESMKTFSNLKLGDKDYEISKIEEFTNLNKIIEKLKSLSNKGNYLAYQLYEKLKKNIDDLPQELSIQISNLNNLIIYKDLTEIFDSSLSLNDLQILPIDIVEESNILFDKLNQTLNHLEENNSQFKNNSLALENNINNYLEKSYDLMNNIFIELDNLTNLLNSPKNKFTEIATIYLNNTPTSYINIIQEINNTYKDYSEDKLNYINRTLELSLKNFDDNYLDSINKQKQIVNTFYTKFQNDSLKIENAEKEDYEKIINNLYNSNEYTDNISIKIKNELRQILINNSSKYILSNDDKNKCNKSIEKSNETAINLDNDEIVDKNFDKIMINLKNNFTENLKYMDKIKEEKFSLIDDVLDNLFSSTEKEKIKRNINTLKANIINWLEFIYD